MKTRIQLRRRRRRGAYFVELAFTLLPMLAMMFAIVDYSMPVFFRSLMMHAVREGSRFGITYRTFSVGQTHTDAIKDVVQSQSAGFLSGTTGRNKIQVTFVPQGTPSPVNAPGNIVQVSVVGFTWNHIFPLYRMDTRTVTINATSADRLETLPPGTTPPNP